MITAMFIRVKNDSDLGEAIFRFVMWWRVFYGSLKLVFGSVLLNFVGFPILELFQKMMTKELAEDPSDILYIGADKLFSHFSSHVTYFLALYFIFWGVIDIALSLNLLHKKLWAFPLSIYLIGIFVVYEIYRFFHTHSVILLGIIVIDFFILYLIQHEHKKLILELEAAANVEQGDL